MRILVTGSRDWDDQRSVFAALDATRDRWMHGDLDDDEPVVVVHGACPTGADKHASDWVASRAPLTDLSITEEPHPADWSQGRLAGPRRNAEMVAAGARGCLAFVGPCTSGRCDRLDEHGSHGASGTVRMARKAGIPLNVFGWPVPQVDTVTDDGVANTCRHPSASGIDMMPLGPAKVWRCDHCGLRWTDGDYAAAPAPVRPETNHAEEVGERA